MLTIPSFRLADLPEGVTVYRDSDQDYVFYVLPDIPRLRYGPDKKPIFTFLKFREDASTLKDDSSLGGGYIEFDCELTLPDGMPKQVESILQGWVNHQYQITGRTNPPAVQLATPTYVDGKNVSVSLITMEVKPDGSGMISRISGAGKPSLIGSNVASFSLDLTQRGAELMWQAFQMANIPVSVVYNLQFLARIPAIQMLVYLDSGQMHQYTEKIDQDIDSSVWGDTDQDYTRTIEDIFTKYQVGGVRINDWPSDLSGNSDDVEKMKNEMIEWGWSLISDTLKDEVKDKFDPTKDSDKGGQGNFQHVFRDYFQSYSENLNISVERDQVIEWPIHPQATLQGFLGTPGPDGQLPNKADFFKEISLDDPFFKLLRVRAHCDADFQEDPIYSVKLHIEYGNRVEDYLFQDNTTEQTFQEFVDQNLGKNYTYWTEINYKNTDKVFRSPTKTTDETQLVLGVAALGYLKVNVIAGRVNWDMITSIQVHIRYSDNQNNVPLQEDVLQFTKDTKTATYQRLIWAPVSQPYQYQVIYFLKSGEQIQHDWVSTTLQNLLINDMFQGSLVVRLLSSGGFSQIVSNTISLDYEDQAHSYSVKTTFTLDVNTPDQDWIVPMWENGPKTFRYQSTTLYNDGHSDQHDWQTKEGPAVLLIGRVFADTLSINYSTDLIDFTSVRLIKVTAHYSDPANDIDAIDEFIFTKDKRTAPTWQVPIMDKTHRQYTYNVTYFMVDGTQRQIPDTITSDPTTILQVPVATP